MVITGKSLKIHCFYTLYTQSQKLSKVNCLCLPYFRKCAYSSHQSVKDNAITDLQLLLLLLLYLCTANILRRTAFDDEIIRYIIKLHSKANTELI